MRETALRFVRRLVQNPHYKLLSVLIAVALWWYVQASDTDTRPLRVAVEWLAPDDLVTTEPLPASVLVVVSGSRNALRRIDESEVALSVDLSVMAAGVGEHSLELSTSDVRRLPSTVSAVEIRPPSVSFTLDEVEIRKVVVQPVVVGEPRDGWVVNEIRLEPSVVELRGPSVILSGLLSVDTEPIDLTGLRHDRRVEARLAPPRGVEVRGPQLVEARVDIEPKVEARVFSEVPVFVRGGASFTVDPAIVRVQVEGPAAVLRQIRDRDVVAQVWLPDPALRASYIVSFEETEGARAEVALVAEGVRIVQVEPSQVKVVRQ